MWIGVVECTSDFIWMEEHVCVMCVCASVHACVGQHVSFKGRFGSMWVWLCPAHRKIMFMVSADI